MSGQEVIRYDISAISNANPCVVTTSAVNEFVTHNFIRLTDLNGSIPVLRGCDQINNKKFRIVVIDTTNFSLQDPITFVDINSTNFTPYVTGGYCSLVQDEFIYSGD
jgi:hypothetical protein